MQKQIIALIGLAAFVIAVIWTVAPRAVVTLNETGTELVGIDLTGLTAAKETSVEMSAQRRSDLKP
jgi:hypothetical protein